METTKILITADGTHTLMNTEKNITYHSRHGALQESMHVFIEAGLKFAMTKKKSIHVFEMGFGTGLNALLTLRQAVQQGITVRYNTIETSPVPESIYSMLNYGKLPLLTPWDLAFTKMHALPEKEATWITPQFSFIKHYTPLLDFEWPGYFDVIYFDAFAPAAQPELWTEDIFRKLYLLTSAGGCLVTYCSKGTVRRAMEAAGWQVKKLPGPPGKREMVRAIKVI